MLSDYRRSSPTKGQNRMQRTKATARILKSRKQLFSYVQYIRLIYLHSSCQCHMLLQYVRAVLANLYPVMSVTKLVSPTQILWS